MYPVDDNDLAYFYWLAGKLSKKVDTKKAEALFRKYLDGDTRSLGILDLKMLLPLLEEGVRQGDKQARFYLKAFKEALPGEGWEPLLPQDCDLCENPAVWSHGDGGLRCDLCPKP